MSALSTINLCGDVFMLKIVYPICCGIDVQKSLLLQRLVLLTNRVLQITKRGNFQPLPRICTNLLVKISILHQCLYGVYRQVLAPCF